MPPGPTTLLPVLGAETLPGAADLAQEGLVTGAADETLGQAGPHTMGPRVDEPRARRLAGSATHSRTAVRHDVTRFSGDSHPTRLLGHLGHVRPVDETRSAAETSARVDKPRVEHSWPLPLVNGIGFELEFWTYPSILSSTSLLALLPERASEELLVPSLTPVRTPSSSDLIGEIFGGGLGSRESRPLPAPRVALTPSDVAAGPDVFRNRIVRSAPSEADSPKGVSLKGAPPPKPPRPFSRVLDPLGTGEFIMNPLTSLLDLDEIQRVSPAILEVMRIEDIATVTLRLAGLKTEIDESIDNVFTGVFDEARAGLKLVYDRALTRVSRLSTRAHQNGFVVLELQDAEALLTLAGIRYDVGRRMGVMELTQLIRDEILAPLGTQRRTYNVLRVLNLAKLHAPSLAGTSSGQGTAFSGVFSDARSSRPEERRDEQPSDATDTPLIVGTTASAGADADAEDQGEERDHPGNQ